MSEVTLTIPDEALSALADSQDLLQQRRQFGRRSRGIVCGGGAVVGRAVVGRFVGGRDSQDHQKTTSGESLFARVPR